MTPVGTAHERAELARRLKAIGLTTAEIAERLQVSKSTVNSYFSVGNKGGEDPLAAGTISDPEACRGHWGDLLDSYPRGLPVAPRGPVRFVEGAR